MIFKRSALRIKITWKTLKRNKMKISEWKSQKETVAAKNDIIKTLKKGTPNEILANRKKVVTQNALKKMKQ